jgi:hypothetical protein
VQSINIAKTIKVSLNASTQDDIIQLTASDSLFNLSSKETIVSRNIFIKNLKAYASIKSLPEAELPDFLLEDSETEKLNKVLDVEWGANRKQLNLLLGVENDWMSIGETSLLNPAGYPYRIYNLLDIVTDNLAFELGDNASLAVKIEDVGFGLLDENDVVNIYGSYIEELLIQDSYVVNSVAEFSYLIDNESIIVSAANQNRNYFLLQNNSEHLIFLSFSNLSGANGINIKPGGHYEFSASKVAYYGDLSVYCEYNASVLVIQGFL